MLRRLTLALALLAALVVLPAGAEVQVDTKNVLTNYDLDSVSFIYPYFEAVRTGTQRITTVGSSTTVTAVAGTPFTPLGIGDELDISVNGVNTVRWVATCVPSCGLSATSITVDTAVDLTAGYTFSFRHLQTALPGWMSVSSFLYTLYTVQIDQANTTTGITWQMECRTSATSSTGVIVVGPITVLNAAVPYSKGAADFLPWDSCRLGIKLTSTDDGGDAGANAEKINIYLAGRRQ